MKVICPRESLLAATQLTSMAVAVRQVKPILANLKVVADSDRLTLSATDLELGIRHELRGIRVEEEGEAILSAVKSTQILREATDADLTVETNDTQLRIYGKVNEWEMGFENPAEFPDIPKFADSSYYEIPSGPLSRMIKRTVFSVAKEVTKFAMTGVLWEVEGKNLRLVATDSKRLALAIGPVTGHGAGDTKGQSHLVPTKAMQLLERHLQSLPDDVPVKVALRTNEALFHTDTTTIYTRLVEGRYPPYREIFPKKMNVKIPIPVQPFLTAVRQSAVMIDDEAKRVGFTFTPGNLVLQAHGPTVGRSKVPMAIEYEGEPISINFDPNYLIDLLRVLDPEDSLVLEMVDGNRPALFKCGSDYSYLVMPLS